MPQKEQETAPEPLKPEEVTELQALLQTDNIAPVDRMTFGMRLAELIIRVRNMAKPRSSRKLWPNFRVVKIAKPTGSQLSERSCGI